LTPRTKRIGEKLVTGIPSILRGVISAFTSELEKARLEAIERAKDKVTRKGANAIIGLDIESSGVF